MRRSYGSVALLMSLSLTAAFAQPTAEDAARLLEQSSFGVTNAAITQVQSSGIAAYIDQQLTTPATGYSGFPVVDTSASVGCPPGSSPTCRQKNYSPFLLQNQFYRNALNGRDQLRQRVAFALSQIFVVSGEEIDPVYALASYQQMLLDDAFGSYRQLLEDITLSPVMGRYLDLANNDRADPVRGIAPNENYAREVLQLFSIGLVKLNLNGTPQLDAQGDTIPAYDQSTVENFSRVFTGWTYPVRRGETLHWNNRSYFVGDLEPIAEHHDTDVKHLLNGTTLPAGQRQTQDLRAALDNIAGHPNVGPFIGRQLIQHLVTSNPSPAYIARIATVFNDNGRGQRGDLAAVVRAILLDADARGDVKTNSEYGKLREPALLLAGAMRGIGGSSDGVYLHMVSAESAEDIYNAPSVFSFYPPDYPIQGTQLVGPGFGIFDAATVFNRMNFVNRLLDRPVAADPAVPGSTGSQFDLSSWQTLARNPDALLDRIDRVFFHGALSNASRNIIWSVVDAVPPTDPILRTRVALYLALTSSQYQVEQ